MTQIPDKRYFKMGEVSRLTGLEPHVIRYWETEFPQLKPLRAGSRQRLYTRADVELVLTIGHLLYQEKYTIAGAKQKLKNKAAFEPKPEPGGPGPSLFPQDQAPAPRSKEPAFLAQIKAELGRIIKVLS
ncbi:MAG: MerR family transcriptional regulator [Deltaproteobacteria bacterium]|nr:MerR family transcriptional regulator [Deltaproteobacteria bacterium]